MSLTLTQISEQIQTICDNNQIIYNSTELPIKVGPDCYLFYAVPNTDDCQSHGACKQIPYYALTGGSTVTVEEVAHTSPQTP